MKRHPLDRFMDKVRFTGTCWEWTGALEKGYGWFLGEDRRPIRAHRFAYKTLVGNVPDGLELDHLCRVRDCVNPDHLEPVTHAENVRRVPPELRGTSFAWKKLITHCPQGHAYSPENTWVSKKRQRVCRTCSVTRVRAIRAQRRAS